MQDKGWEEYDKTKYTSKNNMPSGKQIEIGCIVWELETTFSLGLWLVCDYCNKQGDFNISLV